VTNPFQDRTSVVKKSAAIKVSQCACRKRRQVVFLPRTGAGSSLANCYSRSNWQFEQAVAVGLPGVIA
jgi:hypothetical protein